MRPREPMRPSMTGAAVDLVVEDDGHLAADVVAGHAARRSPRPGGRTRTRPRGARSADPRSGRRWTDTRRSAPRACAGNRCASTCRASAPRLRRAPDSPRSRSRDRAGARRSPVRPAKNFCSASRFLAEVDVLVRLARVLLGPRVGADLDARGPSTSGLLASWRDLLHVLRAVVDDLELELRGAADDRLDALEVGRLEAGQLDDDVGPLLDDGRLRDAELVDAVADRLDALAERVVAAPRRPDRGRGAAGRRPSAALRSTTSSALRYSLRIASSSLALVGRVLEREDDVVAPLAADVHVLDALVAAQPVLDVRRQPVDLVRHRLVDVHLVDEVQAALEIQARAGSASVKCA